MTLRPIQGAPANVPIPDFPTGKPSAVIVPESRFAPHPAESVSVPPPSPMHQPGPVEIRGEGDSILTFRCFGEIPAICRSSMTISIKGERLGDYPSRMIPRLDLATDKAQAFLLALRDGESPIVVADGGSGFQLEFAIAAEGPTFTVGKPGQERSTRRFNPGPSYDVKGMAEHLLADLGP